MATRGPISRESRYFMDSMSSRQLSYSLLAWVPFRALQARKRNQGMYQNLALLFGPRKRGDWQKSNRLRRWSKPPCNLCVIPLLYLRVIIDEDRLPQMI